MRLLIFNPETEYALASGASFYTPPAVVEALRKRSQLLPEKWASEGDIILVDDVCGLKSDFRLADWSMLGSIFDMNPDIKIDPWGWNHALRRKFLDHGVPPQYLPDIPTIDRIRLLAHRRTTIPLNEEWNRIVANHADMVEVPEELHSTDQCLSYLHSHPGCWMKAPWSSSGRGVINTAADMSEEQVRQWCHGIIRRQGSVLAETAAMRLADFATEWMIDSGNACFSGLSCFETSNRGKYISNDMRPQSQLTDTFNSLCRIDLEQVVAWQKEIICRHLSGYSGPLGIDMIVQTDGMLRPLVEVNLRRTMGMLYI